MTRSERRLLIDTGLLGLVLTLFVAALDYALVLEPLERFFYDFRARRCQLFTPPPTDKLIHLDIDDESLESIGRWPWPRVVHAQILEELQLAGCKIVGYDVIFPEAEPLGFKPFPATRPTAAEAGMSSAHIEGDVVRGEWVDHDRLFAESMARHGGAVVPVSVKLGEPQEKGAIYRAMVVELYANPELSRPELAERLKGKKLNPVEVEAEVRASYISARRDGMYDRIEHEVSRGARDLNDLRARILARSASNVAGSSELTTLKNQYQRFLAIKSLHRFAQPKRDDLPPLLVSNDEQATIAVLTAPAVESGYVDYLPMGDGIVRLMPLVAEHRGQLVPQMGLSLACAMLDVPFKNAELHRNLIVLPQPDGSRVEIPVRSHTMSKGRYGMFFDIPWFGAREWHKMYDFPKYERPAQHVPMSFVWEARQMLDRMAKNNVLADDALLFVLSQVAQDRFAQYEANVPPPGDWETRASLIDWALKKLAADGTIDFYKQMDLKDASEQDRMDVAKMLQSHDALQRILEQNRTFQSDLDARRAALRKQFADKAALVGYIAVAALADQVPTSLHARCPGVVVHGVIFNAIMTGDFWRATAPWVSVVLTLVLGLLTTLIAATLPPWKALAGATVLAGGYLLYNGLYFFDYRNLIVGVAGPLSAVAAVWSGATFARYVLESLERARVKRRFENYVDPALVEYVLETDARLNGEKKELSVVFTDLQGFTTLSEVLGEKTVPMLNEYMSLMVPVIRKHRGLLNKFLGDGIMYFFGAPRANTNHAHDAVASVLEMQEVMVEFNKGLVERNLPTLVTRAGISTGEMIVGDAGSAEGSDYTVLGDVVNLGARLESANKVFGTKILMNERTNALVRDRVLTRPVGKLQVVGKKEGVLTFEAIAPIEKATDAQKKLAGLTQEMVTAYINADFERCTGFILQIEQEFGASKLTELYRSTCEQNLVTAPADFSGQIVLTAK